MRNIVLSILLLALISCNNSAKKETPAMPGAYLMLSQGVKGANLDTTYTTLQQLKIYTEDYFMYANVNPADSVSAFGIGTYSTDSPGVVTEHAIFSAADSTSNASSASFTLDISKTDSGYEQIIPDIESRGQKYRLTEAYQRVSTDAKSPLDGAWKETKAYNIKGKDTSVNQHVQYKTYYAGHFIWGISYTDSAKKTHTGIGYGTFTMDGTDKAKETVISSTFSQIKGMTFNVDIATNGADAFSQTVVYPDSSKGIEYYERLKK
jgi:hypothetical protein